MNCALTADMTTLGGMINWATCLLIGSVVPLLFALAVVGFIYGIVKYFLNPDSEDKKNEGKKFMTWGLIALFVMVSMWGIVTLFTDTFQLNSNSAPNIPGLGTQVK